MRFLPAQNANADPLPAIGELFDADGHAGTLGTDVRKEQAQFRSHLEQRRSHRKVQTLPRQIDYSRQFSVLCTIQITNARLFQYLDSTDITPVILNEKSQIFVSAALGSCFHLSYRPHLDRVFSARDSINSTNGLPSET